MICVSQRGCGDGIIRGGSSDRPVAPDEQVVPEQNYVSGGRTWTSPPRSGPSLQPQSQSVHHRTGFSSSSSSCAIVYDILESGRGNGSGGRLACGVAVRGGGERGLGRSRGAGKLTDSDTFVDCDDDESVADLGASGSMNEGDVPMSDVMG